MELAPLVWSDFNGAALPSGWAVTPWASGGGAVLSAGQLRVDGALVGTDGLYTPGRALEFVATFGSEGFQHAGLAVTFNEARWAIFSTGSGGALYARTHTGAVPTDTAAGRLVVEHAARFRIEWNAANVVFSIDGTVVATHDAVIADAMRPVVSDFAIGGQSLAVDALTFTPPVADSGVFVSRVLDAGMSAAWTSASWTVAQPAGTATSMSVRFGDTPQPDAGWTAFVSVRASGGALSQVSRYAQYQATLTSNGESTPSLADVTLNAGRGTPAVSVGDAIVAEGHAGTTTSSFTLTLPWPAASEVQVAYATVPGHGDRAD